MESKSTQHSAQAIVFLLEANIHGQVANRHIRIRDVICLKYVCKIHLDAVSAQRALTRVTLPWPGGHAGRALELTGQRLQSPALTSHSSTSLRGG